MDVSVFPRPATPPEPSTPRGAPRPSREEAEAAVRTLIAWAGDDPAREGLRETPRRVVRAYEELFSGYRQDIDALLERASVDGGGYDDVVLVRDIAFHAHCEHHMVPFFGKVHVAYFPTEKVIGLSKIPRLVDAFARRLQTQERLTKQIAEALDHALQTRGVAVLIEAEHLCMTMRGVRKPGALTLTSQFTGLFRDDVSEQARFFSMVRHGG